MKEHFYGTRTGWAGGLAALGTMAYCRDGGAMYKGPSATRLRDIVTVASLRMSAQYWKHREESRKEVGDYPLSPSSLLPVQHSCIKKSEAMFVEYRIAALAGKSR